MRDAVAFAAVFLCGVSFAGLMHSLHGVRVAMRKLQGLERLEREEEALQAQIEENTAHNRAAMKRAGGGEWERRAVALDEKRAAEDRARWAKVLRMPRDEDQEPQ